MTQRKCRIKCWANILLFVSSVEHGFFARVLFEPVTFNAINIMFAYMYIRWRIYFYYIHVFIIFMTLKDAMTPEIVSTFLLSAASEEMLTPAS